MGDRQHQARVAQNSVTAGWARPQVVAGPVIAVPYNVQRRTTEQIDGKTVTRNITVKETLYLSPKRQSISTVLNPEFRTRGTIHRSVVYDAAITGEARFAIPEDLARLGIETGDLFLEDAVVQMPITDPRGLQTDASLSTGDKALELKPGLGTGSGGTGVHAFLDWTDGEPVTVDFAMGLRGSTAFSMAPRGDESSFAVESDWPHPSFAGFLPGDGSKEVNEAGLKAKWSISNLAIGQSLVNTSQPPLPDVGVNSDGTIYDRVSGGSSQNVATIGLMEPVDLYKQVERSLKYGFLFIGFTFLAFFMFDIVAGARVAAAEYLLTGAGLILFFIMLLAFSEMVGFTLAYIIAGAAIIGLLTSYSAAVLGGWRRAGFIAALLNGLYATLYVLLNLEAWSLVIGSLMLFIALAVVMFATRNIQWSKVAIKPSDDAPEEALIG